MQLNTSGLPGFDGEVGGPAEIAQGTWTHILRSNLLNELRASETRINFLFAPTPTTLDNPLAKSNSLTFEGQSFGGLTPLGISQNIPQGSYEELYQFQDTLSWMHGRHTVRAGVDVGRQIDIDFVAREKLGDLSFTAGGAQSAVDNFLDNYLGASGAATKTLGPTRFDPHTWKSALFAQNDIRLYPDLTVNVGLRYDYLTDPANALPYPAVDPGNPFAPINTVIKVKNDTNNVGPRFGFAYNPHFGVFRDGKTAVHGGVGAF